MALIWSAAAVPEEGPLKSLVPLELILEAQCILFVVELEEI